MNPLRRLDSWTSAHPILVDVLVTCALLLFFVVAAAPFMAPESTPSSAYLYQNLVAYVVSLGLLVPWSFRRKWPVVSASIVVVFSLVHLLLGPEFIAALVAVPMTVYNLAVNGPRWASFAGIGTALLGAVLNGLKAWLFPSTWLNPDGSTVALSPNNVSAFIIMTVLCAAVVLAAWAFGDLARTRRLALRQLADRARRLEVEAAQERELAAADERQHIAREMHDVVAHSLQVIVTQADGGRYAAAAEPRVAVQTLETVAGTGRSALAEMRRLLGVLRGPEAAEHRPQPGLEELEELIETMRLTGLRVEVTTEGAPRRGLPAGGELAVYRAVQEALTNTARHGGPDASAVVVLDWTGRGLMLTVTDDGRGAAASSTTAGAGQGLVGLRERIEMFGGTLRVGPHTGGGFEVHATLPYQEV